MSNVSATITVVRDEEYVEVEVTGYIENYGSYNPHERGEGIGDWIVTSPDNIELTKEEEEQALDALNREI